MNKKELMVIVLCTPFFIGAMTPKEEKIQKNNVIDVAVVRLMEEHKTAKKIKFSHYDNTQLIQLYVAGDNDYIFVKKQIAKL